MPPLFLEKKVQRGSLAGGEAVKFEVVDGQQRILALRAYYADEYPLLASQDKRLRLPASLRTSPVPWAKKTYSDLPPDLRSQLDGTEIDVYEIDEVENPDQIRDLFIRLQSGTALTRQQIRDAWPGNVGPYIEHLAGKLSKKPTSGLFRFFDQRGSRNDEDNDSKDDYVAHRQTCAQLLRLFLTRERDPRAAPGVGAGDLDALYHEYTDFDTRGESARRFEQSLEKATHTLKMIAPLSVITTKGRRNKVRKLDGFATVLFFQDVLRNPLLRFDDKGHAKLAAGIVNFEKTVKKEGRATSGPAIRDPLREIPGTCDEGYRSLPVSAYAV